MILHRLVITLLAVSATVNCRPADQRTREFEIAGGAQARENMPPEAVAHLDSGSAAFRAGQYEESLRHYSAAAEAAPDFGAGWFGVYMAHHELGNVEEAAEALEHARRAVPGATLLHSETSEGR